MLAPVYRPRRPTETAYYRIVRAHLATFVAHAKETYASPLPRYVERELRGYLRCGVFAHGFVRARCDDCGHELLVAFSCKARGACPSCAGRRMANTAAHLVDRVVPAVAVRQWVLSLPFELRGLAAYDAEVLAALVRFFTESIATHYRAWARREAIAAAQTGAVTFVQRFGSSLNLHVHFHVAVLDGVFSRDARGDLRFDEAPPPTRAELEAVARRVERRASAWLAKRFASREDAHDDDEADPLLACARIAMQRGTTRALSDGDAATDTDEVARPTARDDRDAVDVAGYNLEASVRIAADDDLGRERLFRYGARPPFALARLRILPGGRIAYRIKKLAGDRAKSRVMTPIEFLARIAALIPPPRYPLVRYHGVLAPRSKWRRDVVPKPRAAAACSAPRPTSAALEPPRARSNERPPDRPSEANDTPRSPLQTTRRHPVAPPAAPAKIPAHHAPAAARVAAPIPEPAADILAPNIIRVRHWSRLLEGRLYAASPRLDWATLLHRTFDVDVLECPACKGRLRIRGAVIDRALARLVLETLGISPDAPEAARARDPTDLDDDDAADPDAPADVHPDD